MFILKSNCSIRFIGTQRFKVNCVFDWLMPLLISVDFR